MARDFMAGRDEAIARWRRELPEALFDLRIFLLWTRRHKSAKPGRFDKVPYYASGRLRHGVNGSPEDRSELVDLGEVLVAYRRGGYDGIGIALLSDVPVWGFDGDNCIDPNGNLSALARRVVESGTYSERSPSGRGVRSLFAGKIGINAKNFAAGVETFDSTGFVTLTADSIAGESLRPCPLALRAEILEIIGADRHTRDASSAYRSDVPRENPIVAAGVRLPLHVWRKLLSPYRCGCDRSAVAFSIALLLKSHGLTREQTIEIMSAPGVAAPALERRGGDIQSARQWMWRYVVVPAFESGAAHSG
jgi:hypothetical protein